MMATTMTHRRVPRRVEGKAAAVVI